jgi:hypothetical protein
VVDVPDGPGSGPDGLVAVDGPGGGDGLVAVEGLAV